MNARALPQPGSVMVAEDHPEMRELLANELRRAGHQVAEAESGTQLRELLERALRIGRVPDLIVTDVQMPGCGGLEIVRAFLHRIPAQRFLILTALQQSKVLSQAAELGTAGVLIKPFPVHHLVSLVSDLVDSFRQSPP